MGIEEHKEENRERDRNKNINFFNLTKEKHEKRREDRKTMRERETVWN